MDVLHQLMMGFQVAATPVNLLWALIGAFVGTIVGVLPGIGPLGSMAILLSFTLKMDATTAMIFFAGIYYGAMYGGSTTSILLNIPVFAPMSQTLRGRRMSRNSPTSLFLCASDSAE